MLSEGTVTKWNNSPLYEHLSFFSYLHKYRIILKGKDPRQKYSFLEFKKSYAKPNCEMTYLV